MKKVSATLPLVLAALILLSLAACTTPASEAETTQPESTAPAVTEPESTGSPAPEVSAPTETSYDFSTLPSLPALEDITGFESSQWGDPIEDVLADTVADNDGTAPVRVVDYSASFAGLNFIAEYYFYADEAGVLRLGGGFYRRDFYYNVFDPQPGLDKAIADYKLLLAYLTDSYGPPNRSGAYITKEDGDLQTLENAGIDDFLDLKAENVHAIWSREESFLPKVEIILSCEGSLHVNFTSDALWES